MICSADPELENLVYLILGGGSFISLARISIDNLFGKRYCDDIALASFSDNIYFPLSLLPWMTKFLAKTNEFDSKINDDGLKSTWDSFNNCPNVLYKDGKIVIVDKWFDHV